MSSSRARCIAALLGAALIAQVSPAPAQEKPASSASRAEAKRLFDRGRIAFRAKRYEEAILRWQESYAISKEPLILWNIANAFEELHQPAEALAYLQEWAPNAKDSERAELEDRIARLEKEVDSLPPEPETPEEPKPTTPDVEVPVPGTPSREGTPAMEIAGWTMVGVGGAAVITGVVLDVIATSSRPDEDALCRDLDGDLLCAQTGRDDINNTNTLALAGDITWIAGGVVAATGLTLALVSMLGSTDAPSGDEAKASVAPRVMPRIGLAPARGWHLGLGVDGHF